MKRLTLALTAILYITVAYAADTTFLMPKSNITVKGNKVSTIKQINYSNKELGKIYTYSHITTHEVIFSQIQTTKENGVDFICIQTITPSKTTELIADISLKKATQISEPKSNPKITWEVSVAFKQKNGNYVDIGTMVEYRLGYNENYIIKKTTKESYTGTSRLIPFATKAAAEQFIAEIKKVLLSK